MEAASLAALSAPASMRAARAAIIIFFTEYNLLKFQIHFANVFLNEVHALGLRHTPRSKSPGKTAINPAALSG